MGVMNPYGLPDPWCARIDSRQGAPARRVATTGNPMADVEAWANYAGVRVGDLQRLGTDVLLFGDAWVDADGRRVDPSRVVAFGD